LVTYDEAIEFADTSLENNAAYRFVSTVTAVFDSYIGTGSVSDAVYLTGSGNAQPQIVPVVGAYSLTLRNK
jgi:hypothetical protein